MDPKFLDAKEPGERPSGISEWVEFHESIGKLPDEERSVFQLIFYQGFSHDEVSNLLGISIKTVFRRWTKAKLILSDKFV
jgi:RNA polymerase sigma factor (sigma-70 family)